jgi:signal transduction histidine kinase
VRRLLHDVETRLQRLSHELRPRVLDELGLVPAIEFLAEGVASRTGMGVRVEGGELGRRLPAPMETAAYRITQEALSNAAKHARASDVLIRVGCRGHTLRVSVRDDGIGFEPHDASVSRRGIGLMGIRERLYPFGGRLEVRSAPGRGTDLSVEIPVDAAQWAAGSF